MSPMLARAMGEGFDHLPTALQTFHSPDGPTVWEGEVTITPGATPQARAVARMSGFPPQRGTQPFRLTMTPKGEGEEWRRDFGGHILTSHQAPGPDGTIEERLGPLRIRLRPSLEGQALRFEIVALSIGAIPTPPVLRGHGGGVEAVDDQGRITFDVESHAPGWGRLIRYSGYLRPV